MFSLKDPNTDAAALQQLMQANNWQTVVHSCSINKKNRHMVAAPLTQLFPIYTVSWQLLTHSKSYIDRKPGKHSDNSTLKIKWVEKNRIACAAHIHKTNLCFQTREINY